LSLLFQAPGCIRLDDISGRNRHFPQLATRRADASCFLRFATPRQLDLHGAFVAKSLAETTTTNDLDGEDADEGRRSV
jgi:hypothetical protein